MDDIIIAGKSLKKIAEIKSSLNRRFEVKDLGDLHYYLGVNVQQSPDSEKILDWSTSYIQNILEKFGFEKCKLTSTPVSVGSKLEKATDESQVVRASCDQSAVGSLLYLCGWTRPDIACAVSNVTRFCSRPTSEYWTAVKRIFRYLKGTSQFGLLYVKGQNELLSVCSDADWAGDINDRKSASGYIFMFEWWSSELEELKANLHCIIYCRSGICCIDKDYTRSCLDEAANGRSSESTNETYSSV